MGVEVFHARGLFVAASDAALLGVGGDEHKVARAIILGDEDDVVARPLPHRFPEPIGIECLCSVFGGFLVRGIDITELVEWCNVFITTTG